jgi:ferritin-like metal-binding protein YciE
MSLSNLEDLFLHELKDTFDAEKRMTKALPKLAKAASSPELKEAFEKHLAETEGQIERLERVFKLIGKPARGKKCEGMTGLIEEGAELIKEDASDEARDAGLIGAAQKVEHYEIAAYGTMVTYAKMLGLNEVAHLLGKTLDEEKQTDKDLTKLAGSINFEAEHADETNGEQETPRRTRASTSRRNEPKENGRKAKSGDGTFMNRMGKAFSGFVGSSKR